MRSALIPEHALRITEIFLSIQGETSRVGLPTVFIRLTGCPLRCSYCDTEYAFYGGTSMAIASICEKTASYNTPYVTVTGGEPLAQKQCLSLLEVLCDQGYDVSLETGGALDVSTIDARVSRILDIKTPGSGEAHRVLWTNLEHLNNEDEIKFVLCDEGDYSWAKELVLEKALDKLCVVLFSPVYAKLPPEKLAEWILRDKLPVRLQLQMHKILWGEVAGR